MKLAAGNMKMSLLDCKQSDQWQPSKSKQYKVGCYHAQSTAHTEGVGGVMHMARGEVGEGVCWDTTVTGFAR